MDRDLVERAREGDREAFAVLVHQVSDTLYAVAHRILRDTGLAEDALQNALVLAWRRLPKLRDPDQVRSVDPSDPRPCLLRRVGAGSTLGRDRPRAAHERALHAGLERRPRRPRRTGAGVPPALDRAAGGLRPAPLPRAAARGDRRVAGDPRRDGPIAPALRHRRAPRRPRRPSRSPLPRKDGSHDRRPLARTRRSVVDRSRSDPGPRPRRSRPPSSGSKRQHRNGISGSRGGCPA